MIETVISLLLGKAGGLLAGVIAAGFAAWRIYAAGRSKERERRTKAQLEAVRTRHESDARVDVLSDDDVKRRLLDKWRR